jgi:hypothetical protein
VEKFQKLLKGLNAIWTQRPDSLANEKVRPIASREFLPTSLHLGDRLVNRNVPEWPILDLI